jgi:hypothetical protein
MTGQCAFANSMCKMRASIDAEYCPRHQFLVNAMGLEAALDVELGPEWRIDMAKAVAKSVAGGGALVAEREQSGRCVDAELRR